jgi:D-aspartate ligase
MTVPEDAPATVVRGVLSSFTAEVGPAILIPVDDAASVFVDEQSESLAGEFLFPMQPPGLAKALASKREMYELCQEHQIPTPNSLFPASEDEVIEHAERATFPVVAKCINAADAPAASPRVTIAADREELLEAYRSMESPATPNVMIQEYIPGRPETVWMFNGYFDSRSECRIGFTGRKIRQSPPYTGATTLGVCLPNPAVYEATVRLMKAVGYRGILDIGYRFDQRDGQYKLLDVNPRIGGTFRLFVGGEGMDVLHALYLDLTGEEVPASTQQDGRKWVVEPLDLASSLTYFRRGDLRVGQWLRSYKGVREGAWFALDDPLPFLALWGQVLIEWLPARLRAG